MKDIAIKTYNYIIFSVVAVRQCGTLAYMRHQFLSLIGRKTEILMQIHGVNLLIRTKTPDLVVALESLGGEFVSLSRAYDRHAEGLIVDAGGYIGTAAIALSSMYPNAKVVSIEASAENFTQLEKNISGYPNIQAINAALVNISNEKEVSLFSAETGEWGCSIVEGANGAEQSRLQMVRTIAISEVFDMFDQLDTLILKMDIEGGEMAFFESDFEWLNSVGIFVVELHERKVSGVTSAFDQCNSQRTIISLGGEKIMSLSHNLLGDRSEPK